MSKKNTTTQAPPSVREFFDEASQKEIHETLVAILIEVEEHQEKLAHLEAIKRWWGTDANKAAAQSLPPHHKKTLIELLVELNKKTPEEKTQLLDLINFFG